MRRTTLIASIAAAGFLLATPMVAADYPPDDTTLDTVIGTEPPATDPPATDPPATDPPATDPPATDPATTPPVTQDGGSGAPGRIPDTGSSTGTSVRIAAVGLGVGVALVGVAGVRRRRRADAS